VIGVPVPLAKLDGLDSLLSIVQMPAGVPVATVSIGGARNAGILAARILSVGDSESAHSLATALAGYAAGLAATVAEKNAVLHSQL
jgi:5-(carboxyamino)imidazole ribonucleotide mutase